MTQTISIIELKKERHFLTGYKARKNGKLCFVALFDKIEKRDEVKMNEKIKKFPQRAEMYADIREAEIIAEQNVERIKNSHVLLEDNEILEIKIVNNNNKSVHPSLHKSCNAEREYKRNILLHDEALRSRLTMAGNIVSENISNLLKNHSNLVGAEACWFNGDVGIRLVVSCKHYIPEDEPELPEYIDEFRTFVRQGWFKYC